jgi:ABC-type branched-subunit amino acid transport system ATPase component
VLLSQIAITALFALSLDLVLGYAGIVSLGHAAFFGIGAYAAGLMATHGWNDPLLGLLGAGLIAAAAGFVSSFLVLRGSDLTRLMVTLGVALMLFELANKLTSITGGVDGLQGIEMKPIFGLFSFDLYGKTAYIYSVAVLFILFWIARRIVHSPFGLSLRGIRLNVLRMPALGAPVNARLVGAYTLGAAYAGIAGGLADTDHAVRLDRCVELFAVRRTAADPRAGRHRQPLRRADRHGGIHDGAPHAVGHQPAVLAVLAGHAAGTGGALRPRRRHGRPARHRPPPAGSGQMNHALQTSKLVKRFGGFVATSDVTLNVAAGARHALIGPNGAGKTTLINLLTGFLEPSEGAVILKGEDVTHLAQHQRVKRGLARTFQINRLFADMTVLESVTLAVCERRGIGSRWWNPVGSHVEAIDEAAALLQQLRLIDVAHQQTKSLAYGRQRLIEIALALAAKPTVLLLDEPAAGVPTSESRELFETIAQLPREVTILLIEHDMDLVFRFADRISVLVGGALVAEDVPEVIAKDKRVKEVYLGEALDG